MGHVTRSMLLNLSMFHCRLFCEEQRQHVKMTITKCMYTVHIRYCYELTEGTDCVAFSSRFQRPTKRLSNGCGSLCNAWRTLDFQTNWLQVTAMRGSGALLRAKKTQHSTLKAATQFATAVRVSNRSGYTQSVMGHGRQHCIVPTV